MERFFMVTEESRLYKDWFDYKKSRDSLREVYNKFVAENGIEANGFYADNTALYIKPSEKDAETFKSSLCFPENGGLRKFKGNSKIGKVSSLNAAGLTVLRRPMVILYFRTSGGGRFSSRLFDQNGVVYCSFDNSVDGDTPEGFIEMKASEFYKIIEDHDA